MEKVIGKAQRTESSSGLWNKLKEIKIMGMSLPMYLIVAVIVLFAAETGILPTNMVGALAVMMILGSVLNLLGNKIPVIRSYLGGGAVFCMTGFPSFRAEDARRWYARLTEWSK